MLRLDYGEITDAGLQHLASLTRLSELSLDSTHITDEAVASLRQYPALARLNLYHTLVTEKGHATLKAALPRTQIIWDPEARLPNRRRS